MIVVDTSVWVDHFHQPIAKLVEALHYEFIAVHPLVIEEIAVGSIKDRDATLALLEDLPKIDDVTYKDTLRFIDEYKLSGKGIGVVDIHLLASVIKHGGARLWSRDKRLHNAAVAAGVSFVEN